MNMIRTATLTIYMPFTYVIANIYSNMLVYFITLIKLYLLLFAYLFCLFNYNNWESIIILCLVQCLTHSTDINIILLNELNL